MSLAGRPGSRSASPAARRILLVVVAFVVALLLSLTAGPAKAAGSAGREFLLVADPAAQTLTTFRTSDLRRTGQLAGIEVGSHVGTLQLPDGRLIVVDDAHARVLALRITRQGRPQVVQSVPIPSTRPWERAAWGAADADLRYFAFTSDFSASASQLVTVVDLYTFRVSQLEVPLTPTSTGSYAEAQVYLAGRGDALTLVDADPDSPRFRRIAGTVALDAPTGGPVAGQPAAGTQGHSVALNPSGRRAFVSNGGDGTVTAVDTRTRSTIRTLRTGTPLTGGGYLTVVRPGTELVDLIPR